MDSERRIAYHGKLDLNLDDPVRFKSENCELYGEKVLHMERTIIPEIHEEQDFVNGRLQYWGIQQKRSICENLNPYLTATGKVI